MSYDHRRTGHYNTNVEAVSRSLSKGDTQLWARYGINCDEFGLEYFADAVSNALHNSMEVGREMVRRFKGNRKTDLCEGLRKAFKWMPLKKRREMFRVALVHT